jgi:hypothetical protein
MHRRSIVNHSVDTTHGSFDLGVVSEVARDDLDSGGVVRGETLEELLAFLGVAADGEPETGLGKVGKDQGDERGELLRPRDSQQDETDFI